MPPLRGRDGHLSSTWYCGRSGCQIIQHPVGFPTAWGEIYRHQRDLSSVFMTVGDADTPWHPQFFGAVTFESLRLTENGATVDPSDGLRHGDVRIGDPREPVFRFSSCLLLVHHVACPGRVIALCRAGIPTLDHHMFCECYFAAMWDSLDVAAPGDCSSNRRWSSGPSSCQRSRFRWRQTDRGHRRRPSLSRHGAVHARSQGHPELRRQDVHRSHVQAFSVVVRHRL